jgi:polyphosphate kinase
VTGPPDRQLKWDVPTPERLRDLAAGPLPLGLPSAPATRSLYRDLYFDTADGALSRRGVVCRWRIGSDDRRALKVRFSAGDAVVSETPETEAAAALAGQSEAARRLRGVVNPADLQPLVELEVERLIRQSRSLWPWRGQFAFYYDTVSVRRAGIVRTFQEMKVRRLRGGSPRLDIIGAAMPDIRPILEGKLARAQRLSAGLEREALARSLASGRTTALLVIDRGRVALRRAEGRLRLPVGAGQGEAACRHLLQETLGSSVGDLAFLGTVAGVGAVHLLDVWLARRVRMDQEASADIAWLPLDDVIATAGGPSLGDPETLTAIAFALRSGVSPEPGAAPPPMTRHQSPAERALTVDAAGSTPLLDPDISLVEFNARVLALGEDPRTPIVERLGFLAIVSSNLDEFFMVNVGALKQESQDGRLDAVGLRLRALLERQTRAAEQCLETLRSYGVTVRTWDGLSEAARTRMVERFHREIYPLVTPRAITMSPGFPVPLLPHLTLCMAVSLTDEDEGSTHFAYLRMPERMPRFLPTGDSGDVIPIEEVVRANVAAFYPDQTIDGAYLFRLTRAAEIELDDREAGDLLQAVSEAVGGRASNAVVRVEVERSMPRAIRDRIRWELRFEREAEAAGVSDADVYEVNGLLDLRALRGLGSSAVPAGTGRFPPLAARDPFAQEADIWRRIDAGDVLLFHPYDDYAASTVRFFAQAADDPQVASIRLTLYRVGEQSPIVDALLRARASGKEVILFVELKARFDEARNVAWVQRLEDAGATVVYGVVGLKNHAKVGLVLRRTGTGDELRRYVHIATGNYNAATARQYTDLGLLSADQELGADVHELFNELTGSSQPPAAEHNRIVVAPMHLLPHVLAAIETEIGHARAGREAKIRAKLNGLADTEVIRSLYRASEAGVDIELVVRGLCTLRPGLPGISSRIRVVSILGRFLEHARIYHFANGGDDRYYIGSADWRPRNLRRRVEVIVSILDPDHHARLGNILDVELSDPNAWELQPDGRYRRHEGAGTEPGSQERFASESTSDPQAK